MYSGHDRYRLSAEVEAVGVARADGDAGRGRLLRYERRVVSGEREPRLRTRRRSAFAGVRDSGGRPREGAVRDGVVSWRDGVVSSRDWVVSRRVGGESARLGGESARLGRESDELWTERVKRPSETAWKAPGNDGAAPR